VTIWASHSSVDAVIVHPGTQTTSVCASHECQSMLALWHDARRGSVGQRWPAATGHALRIRHLLVTKHYRVLRNNDTRRRFTVAVFHFRINHYYV